MGEHDRSSARVAHALRLRPHDDAALLLHGMLQTESGDLTKADSTLARAHARGASNVAVNVARDVLQEKSVAAKSQPVCGNDEVCT